MAKRLIRFMFGLSIVGAGVMLLAGTWRDPWLWAYLGLWALLGTYAMAILDDDLARERFKPPTQGADRLSLRIIRIVALSHMAIGALDTGRWHFAPVSPEWRIAGLVGTAVTAAMVFYAMSRNRFFSSVVRIQTDRGHHVIDSGPYAIVRHPGYAGMLPLMVMSGLALGSWLAVGMGLVYSALVLKRVLVEDAFLRANLAGYADYASRVQYRLIPKVW